MFFSFQAAVRSSRRKRNQYVVDLRDLVYDLKRRREEAVTQNELLKQLTSLWERLCTEVESEIQDGVRQQLNFTIPSFKDSLNVNRRISAAENHEINNKINSIRKNQMQNVSDEVMSNLLLNNEGILQFENCNGDRGAMEL